MKKAIVIMGVLTIMFGLSYVRNRFNVFAADLAGYTDLAGTDAVEMMKHEKDLLVLDVRSAQEFTGELGHLKGAKLVPVGELTSRTGEFAAYKKKKVLVICRSGVRSRHASSTLVNSGFEHVYNIAPGMAGMNQIPGAQIEH